MGLREVAAALLGVSAYQPPANTGYGLDHDDPVVKAVRQSLGGHLATQPTTRLRWYLADLQTAQFNADAGDLSTAAQLVRAMRRDGVISGLLGTLSSGVVRLPKRFYGDEDSCAALRARNGTRSVFDDMCPPSELALMACDGKQLGVSVGELVPVPGRDFPVLIRLEPEFLRYRWIENRWYYNSIAGPLPITPGDGRWVLHTPGGRIAPWMNALWPATGRAFINKEHALLHRSNYSAKLANPARYARTPLGSTETERQGFIARLIAWGVNTVFELPPGWEVGLLETNGQGYEVFQDEIDASDKEAAIAIVGNEVLVTGGSGFQNSDTFRAIRADIVKDVAEQLAYTINTQILPPFIAARWGLGRLQTGAMFEWEIARPKDLQAESSAMQTAATALAALREELAKHGVEIDVKEYLTRFGIPVKGDADGDGAPDHESDELEQPANDHREAA